MAKKRFSNSESTVEMPKVALNKENWQDILRIFGYVLPYKGLFTIGLIALLLSTLTSMAFPYLASMLADTAMPGTTNTSEDNVFSINQIGLFLVLILVVQAIFSYARIVLFAYVSEYTMADIRKDVYRKLISLELAFFERRRVGELTSRITADVTQLQNAVSTTLAEFLKQVATLIVGISIIFYTSPWLTLVMLSTFPVAIVVAIIFGRFIRKLSRQTQDALASANVVVEETLQSVQVVKAFTNELFEIERYDKRIQKVIGFALTAAKYRGFFVSFLITAVFGGIVLVLWQGALLVEAGGMSIGELIRFVLYTFFIGGAVGGIGGLYGDLQKAIGASERVIDILEEESEFDLLEQPEPLDMAGDIIYDGVHFSYPTRKDIPIFTNLSLHIKKGQKVALVGPSGAGKSTVVQLLARFYQLDAGQISIKGKAIETYNMGYLRKQIGVVPQEVLLFGGTIRDNIRYGQPGADEEAIVQAAQQANAWEFIQGFPDGLDTLVGERGVKLSGGQRQRIAIARAILKDPRILILDEATSSLDAESESLVQGALDKLMENRTTIIIAHRLATIREVDCIYVLDKGKIVEQGTHAALSFKENGVYQNLLKLQFEMA